MITGRHKKLLSPILGALFVAIGGLDCQRSNDWNSVFQRPHGWWYADGGSSAELPDGKRVWLFGDSAVRNDTGSVFNTLAVQASTPGRAPAPDEIRFFARGPRGEVVDVSQDGRGGVKAWVEPENEEGTPATTWLWPTDVIATGDKLVAIFSELGCDRGGAFPGCRAYLGNMGFRGHSVLVVDNPSDVPERWNVRTTSLVDRGGRHPSDRGLHWGSALLEEGGWMYVFGTGLSARYEPEEVKVARVVPGNLARYDLWQFLTPEGWKMFPTGPSRTDLSSVAQGGSTELSVDRVVRNGEKWLVMVQVDAVAGEVVVRSSPAREVESIRWAGPEAGPDVRRFPLSTLDPASAGGINWAGRAHRRHAAESSSLLVSFFSQRTESLRFVDIPLSEVRRGW